MINLTIEDNNKIAITEKIIRSFTCIFLGIIKIISAANIIKKKICRSHIYVFIYGKINLFNFQLRIINIRKEIIFILLIIYCETNLFYFIKWNSAEDRIAKNDENNFPIIGKSIRKDAKFLKIEFPL